MPRNATIWQGKEPTSKVGVQNLSSKETKGPSNDNNSTPILSASLPKQPQNPTPCPSCGNISLKKLESGSLGCISCAAIFSKHEHCPVIPQPPEETAIDQIQEINRMLRRNVLILGPGGIPLANPEPYQNSGLLNQNSRNRRRAQR